MEGAQPGGKDMDKSLEQRVRDLASETLDIWAGRLDVLAYHRKGTPIEKLLYVAFKALEIDFGCVVDPEPKTIPGWANTVAVFDQVPVAGTKYTADFWLIKIGTRDKAVIVECDGHDFHERTKQQAEHDKKRDRKLTALGHKILRFTGSEIWRDPMKCAREALELANAAHFDHYPEFNSADPSTERAAICGV